MPRLTPRASLRAVGQHALGLVLCVTNHRSVQAPFLFTAAVIVGTLKWLDHRLGVVQMFLNACFTTDEHVHGRGVRYISSAIIS